MADQKTVAWRRARLKQICDGLAGREAGWRSLSKVSKQERAVIEDAARNLRRATLDFDGFLARLPSDDLRFRAVDSLIEFLEPACLLASFGAPLPAVDGEVRKQLASASGKKSAKSRALEASETWKPHALELARLSRQINPALSQDKVAAFIAESWTLKIHCPSHRSLTGFLSECIRSNALPERVRQRAS